MSPKTLGKINTNKYKPLRVAAGVATNNKTGIDYNMSTCASSGMPLVESSKTGKLYVLSWQEIIDLAIKAGVDDES